MEPHSLVGETGEGGSVRGLACGLKNQRHGPPTGSGGREKWFVDGRKSGKRNGFSPPFPKGYLSTSPACPAGGRAVTSVTKRGRRPGIPQEVQPSPHNPTREGSPEGRTSSLWGSFPHFFPRNGAPAGQAPFPAVPTAGRPQQGPGFQPPAGLSSRETKKSPPHTRQGLM